MPRRPTPPSHAPKPKRSEAELAEVADLVSLAYQRSGARSWAAFARQAGLADLSGLYGWRDGHGTPDAVNLIRILDAGGLLVREKEQPRGLDLVRLTRRLEAAAAGLATLAEEISRARSA